MKMLHVREQVHVRRASSALRMLIITPTGFLRLMDQATLVNGNVHSPTTDQTARHSLGNLETHDVLLLQVG